MVSSSPSIPPTNSDPPSMDFFTDDDDASSILDEQELSLEFSHSGDDFIGAEEEKNQTKDLLQRVAKDTRRVTYWRVIVTLAILGTAAVVTGVTYTSLKREEHYNFETAFEQFARTVGDAAVQARQDLRLAYKQFAETIAANAEGSGASWPLYTPPFYEKYAQNFLAQSRGELVSLRNIVRDFEIEAWNNYTAENYAQIVEESHLLKFGNLDRLNSDPSKFTPYLWKRTKEGPVPDVVREINLPTLASSPPGRDYSGLQWNFISHPNYKGILEAILTLKNETLITPVQPYAGPARAYLVPEEHAAMHDELPEGETEHPHSFFFHPIRQSVEDESSRIVAILGGAAPWDQSMRELLPVGVNGIMAVIDNTCNQSFTYEINGPVAKFKGMKDLHDPQYDALHHDVDLAFHSHPDFATTPGHCKYSLRVYPTQGFEDEYHTTTPLYQAIIVAATFVLIAVTFVMYDIMVANRNRKLIVDAARSNAIVSQLFPGDIAAKMMDRKQQGNSHNNNKRDKFKNDPNVSDKDILSGELVHSSKPLAELYLEASVMFADIKGFTSWSSVRSPDQVFQLLETVYRHFDEIGKRRSVFKVETIGDCYVAAAGLPVPRRDHALLMARFARDIMNRMHLLAKKLEQKLGPDTGDLDLRIGIHSGSITAGVLRGERARFQLFGDTVNTAARLESCGEGGKILVSREFANLLQSAGKSSWVEERKDMVSAKGLGQLKTFWLVGTSSGDRRSVGSMASAETGERMLYECGNRKERLIDWCCQTLEQLLRQIVARRKASGQRRRSSCKPSQFGTSFFDEVKEVIVLPDYDPEAEARQCDPDTIVLEAGVVEQLRIFVSEVANLYNNNHFHNFEHASHVLMSVVKLMARIVAPKHNATKEGTLHDHTYGITSDPLTQFACAFSALIHDADHVGVSNAQLVKEQAPITTKYQQSCAEQNSLELSWDLLMEQRFAQLRSTICATSAEEARFRSLVVNSVMATDIVDKALKELRNARWDKAFKNDGNKLQASSQAFAVEDTNRKATIVIEHLIQASDVSHMMQHWHVYRKWNTLFFKECYQAFQEGRAEKDPSEFWYKGEIGFFDFYIIPLAKKLKECGVFGVSSGEYLEYAQNNRNEWVEKGEQAVEEMIQMVKSEQDIAIPRMVEC